MNDDEVGKIQRVFRGCCRKCCHAKLLLKQELPDVNCVLCLNGRGGESLCTLRFDSDSEAYDLVTITYRLFIH